MRLNLRLQRSLSQFKNLRSSLLSQSQKLFLEVQSRSPVPTVQTQYALLVQQIALMALNSFAEHLNLKSHKSLVGQLQLLVMMEPTLYALLALQIVSMVPNSTVELPSQKP